MDKDGLVDYCERLQGECYEFFEASSAPTDDEMYMEMVDWIEDQLRKSTVLDFLDEEVMERLDDDNAHMAASAVASVIK